MNRITLRWGIACALIILCAAVTLADPLPVPRFPAGNQLNNTEFNNGTTHWTLTHTDGKDKTKCGGAGNGNPCAFRFIGKAGLVEKTTLKQVITAEPTVSDAAIVVASEMSIRPLETISCLKITLKVTFNDPATTPLKDIGTVCGSGNPSGYFAGPAVGPNTSFSENSWKKIVLKIKHEGIGSWLVDGVYVGFEDK